MAEEQALLSNEMYWRRVVLDWVKSSGLITSDQLNSSIESIRLHSAFDAFKNKIAATNSVKGNTVFEFLRVHFPDFELKLDDFDEIPEYDNVYVFSLMLYFSCVRLSIPYFQNACKRFDEQCQYSVKTFLNSFVTDSPQKIRIDRSFLDAAFTKATSSARIGDEKLTKIKCMNSVDTRDVTSTPLNKFEMKKPSSHTPKIVSMEWKMKNLKHLLDSARSENCTLEKQNEQLAHTIQQLTDDKQRYLMKIKAMQLAEQLSEDCTLRLQSQSSDRLHDHFRKQLEEKEALIEMLQDEISKAKENACMEMERLSAVKMSNLSLKRDIQCLESSIETLNLELSRQTDISNSQSEVIDDLRRFIRENRLAYNELLPEPLDSSFECFEKFVANSSANNSCIMEPENLASTVVEVKLKDQEKENERLLSEIEKYKLEIKLLKEEYCREKVNMNETLSELQKSLKDVVKSRETLEIDFEEQRASIKQHDEDRKRERVEAVEKVAELQKSLAEMVESKDRLAAALEKQEATMKQQEEARNRKEAEMNTKTADLQRALDVVEGNRKQLQEALEKEATKSSVLGQQLEVLAKEHVEDRKRQQAEVDEKVAELQKSLAEMVESKDRLAAALEKQETTMKQQEEARNRKEAEMNTKTADLQRALDVVEGNRKQLQEALEKEVTKSSVLGQQLEVLAKEHVEDRKRQQAEVDEKVAELQKSLAEMVESKDRLAAALEKQEATMKQQEEARNRKEAEMNTKTADLQRALDVVEGNRRQLQEALEKEVTKTIDLSSQLENLAKEYAEACNMKDEMIEKSDELSSQYEIVKKRADDLESQCIKLLKKVSTQDEEINSLKADLERVSSEHQCHQTECMQGNAKMSELLKAVEEKDSQLQTLFKAHEEQQQVYLKDTDILSVKLYQARTELKEKCDAWKKDHTALQEVLEKTKKAYEEKVREARIEFENKMERLKERMKDLHKESKFKQEREREELIATLEQSYKKRLEVMEGRCATLQKQVAEMNERDLKNRKENQLLQTKLKTLEENKSERKSLLLPPPAQARLRCNLTMEDEEGELFNNMYLADLQNGRCVSPVPSDGGLERFSELMRRNSMRPPHLRTHYAAIEPDGDLPSDDTRENVSTTFDDSSTGLITRRKVSGITSYKRPGPPTPSKKAGRLSLSGALPGIGSEIQYKEALQDSNVNAGGDGGAASGVAEQGAASSGCRAGRTKTPGKFKQMISSSSLLSNFQRDEDPLNSEVGADIPPLTLPRTRRGGAIRNSKTVSQHTQRSAFFDLNRQFSPEARAPSAMAQTVAGAPTVAASSSAPYFGALAGCFELPLPGSSLSNIRRQRMFQREKRNRQVDLQRNIDGSPLGRYPAASVVPRPGCCDARTRHAGGTGCVGMPLGGTALKSIAECSSLEEAEGHRFGPTMADAAACCPCSLGTASTAQVSPLRPTFASANGACSHTTNAACTETSASWYVRRRQQRRNRQLDLQRQIDVSPLRSRAPCATGTNSFGVRKPTATVRDLPTLPSTLVAYASSEPTVADSGFCSCNVSTESPGCEPTECSSAHPDPGGYARTQPKCASGVLVFLCVVMGLGILAQLCYCVYGTELTHSAPSRFGCANAFGRRDGLREA